MATGHFYYDSTMGGVPALDRTAGAMIALIDYILDIGAPGAYWEKVYTGTNKAVYRATTGQRYYLRVENTDPRFARFTGYETMSDVDTGTNPFPSPTSDYNFVQSWYNTNESSGNSDWWAVGDSRCFILLVKPNATGSTSRNAWTVINFFGETNPFDPLDAYSTMLAAESTDYTGTSIFSQDDGPGLLLRSMAVGGTFVGGAEDIGAYWANLPNGTKNSIAARGVFLRTIPNHSGIYADITALPILPYNLTAGTGDDAASSTASFWRARFPYLYSPPIRIGNGIAEGDNIIDGPNNYKTIYAQPGATGVSNNSTYVLLMRTSNNEPGRV